MQAKLFEVKDSATLYSVLAVKYRGGTVKEQWLLDRAGLGEGAGYSVQLTDLESGETRRDPFKWGNRTLFQAHLHIAKEWDSLSSGDVVDVQFLLGESSVPKLSSFSA